MDAPGADPRGPAAIRRVDAVEQRLQHLAARPSAGLTRADPASGERWERGQVWAHLGEFPPYWIEQARLVLAAPGGGEPVLFGRTKRDPGRLAAIEQDRGLDTAALFHRLHAHLVSLRAFLGGLGPRDWDARGRHPSLGEMTVEQLVEEFLVGHLEEHAAQLEELAG